MKLIDEKGKLFSIINIIDLFVLILIVSLVIFGFQKVTVKNDNISVNTKKVSMKVWVSTVREETINVIQENELVRDSDKNLVLGKMIKKEVVPATRQITTDDGKIIVTEIPDRYDVSMYIEGDAIVSPNSIILANNDIRVGTNLKIKGLKFAVAGTVFEVDIIE